MNLTDLEQDDWGPPPPDTTRLITRCHELRRVPLDQLAPADLRLLIGQRLGLSHLIPLALAELRANPLTESTFYPGDLLHAVLRAGVPHWAGHPDQHAEVAALVRAGEWPPELATAIMEFHRRGILIDVGGVLATENWDDLAARFTPELTTAELLAAVFGGNDDTVLIGRVSEDKWWQLIGDRLGLRPKPLAALRAATDEVSWNHRLLTALADLRSPRTRIVILSNAWPSARRRLNRSGHRATFDGVVLSAEAGVAKPDPRSYQTALRTLALPAHQTLFVDDTPGHLAAAGDQGIAGHLHTGTTATITALTRFVTAGSGRMAP
ncbi:MULTISPECIES: contact-dependent growth inhibition system immunity protein [unclassified Crossiella]|uniref:contact-dependent growth inhibition system immunity protein n=1 Tax=unclassified Crossiella TaxID=2620835 RepID=UPI001FFF82FC|nr:MULTISPECIES: contact-dependent growth inhibition system immunity protein [unclassified Crossiella]MCK2240615.1 contact-dependent growth inhibition system immunity protein [Crossiella sp. S99.2]MCK2252934.1 contact-dependent growth inhibition system immunity protein [Crossiella sp. S99.1]